MEKLHTEYADLGDIRIAYHEHGSGQVLILLHGNSESKGIFSKHQLVHFQAYRTLALDSRGHGESISNDTSYSISQYSEDVIRFCKAKGITRAFVLGYSDGGNIALFLAKKEPILFPKIVAISPNYLASGTTEGTLKAFRSAIKLLRFLGKLGFKTRKAILHIDLMLNDIGITAEELGSIRTSLRILYAEHDLIKEEHILEMGRLIPGATLRKIGHCNHVTILSKREAIEDILDYFAGEGANC
jgi:pimeloyl-ACP methyl ester carboxylesterase